MTLDHIIVSMFLWIGMHTNYKLGAAIAHPAVVFTDPGVVCASYGRPPAECHFRHRGILATYDGAANVIFMRYELSDMGEGLSRSTLLHELVHAMQWHNNPGMSPACKEAEAYELELKWGEANNVDTQISAQDVMRLRGACNR